MAKMAATKATKFIVVAVLVAIFLLMSTEVATAALDAALTDHLKLGIFSFLFQSSSSTAWAQSIMFFQSSSKMTSC